ncbi:MAG: NCS2 family permease [Rhizobiales bacterium]|nr:NCS2 family permease [Hyphomicrobiales bacterium]NRB12844.1 NCS2 family permease [Hyphomicrobiales bacterium]
MLEKQFKLTLLGTDVRTEIVAGITTFLTMAYIVIVNPVILANAGMDMDAVFVATCVAAAVGTLIMGLLANYPIALAPGMGLNAYFAFVVVPSFNGSWQIALGCVFLSGMVFLALSITPARSWLINSIPKSLKMAIGAGIGLFLAFIGMQSAGIVVNNPATLVGLGDFASASVLLACLGLLIIAVLHNFKVKGAILIAILAITVIAILLGIQDYNGILSPVPSIAPTFLQMDIAGALTAGAFTIIFTFLLVDILDTAGTLVAVAHSAKLTDEDGKLPRLGGALLADSGATLIGSVFGTSTTTSFVESASGVQSGGRSGLTAVVVAILFLLALFFSPLVKTIPAYATAPALIFVACLMARSIKDIDWDDVTEYVPAMVTMIAMPLTYSIATGIGLGFIAYFLLKLFTGKFSHINPAVMVISLLFFLKLLFEHSLMARDIIDAIF